MVKTSYMSITLLLRVCLRINRSPLCYLEFYIDTSHERKVGDSGGSFGVQRLVAAHACVWLFGTTKTTYVTTKIIQLLQNHLNRHLKESG